MQVLNLKLYSKGLTLIEILVVLIIILLIWVIIIKQYQGKIELAKKVCCSANIRVIQGQLEIYEAKMGHYPKSQYEFNKFLRNDKFFASYPKCPYDYPYTYNVKTNKVILHKH